MFYKRYSDASKFADRQVLAKNIDQHQSDHGQHCAFPKRFYMKSLNESDLKIITVYFMLSEFSEVSLCFRTLSSINEPRCEKTGLRGFRPGLTQTRLYNHRRWLEA